MKKLTLLLIAVFLITPGCSDDEEYALPPAGDTLPSEKEITEFSITASVPGITPEVKFFGSISGTDITVIVPEGTDVTAIVATFTTSGTSITVGATEQVSGTTANNFTNAVTYTVTAEDDTTQNYTVSVIDSGLILDGNHTISESATLTELSGYLGVGGYLSINSGLSSLPGLENLAFVAGKIGEIWGMDTKEVANITTKNANEFFKV